MQTTLTAWLRELADYPNSNQVLLKPRQSGRNEMLGRMPLTPLTCRGAMLWKCLVSNPRPWRPRRPLRPWPWPRVRISQSSPCQGASTQTEDLTCESQKGLSEHVRACNEVTPVPVPAKFHNLMVISDRDRFFSHDFFSLALKRHFS